MSTELNRRVILGERLHVVLGTLAGILFSIIAGLWAVGQSGNPIKSLMLGLGGLLLVVGTLNPRLGLYFLITSSACLDLFKRLMVAFGLGGMTDIAGVLAVAPLCLVGIFAGTCVLYPIFTKKMLQKDERRLVYFGLALVSLALGVGYNQANSIPELFGSAANQAAYALLLPIVFILYRDRKVDDLKHLLRFSTYIYVPVALYGVFQFWFGYSGFEMDFLRSGLTVTVTNLDDVHPRPFSTLNSPHAFSVLMWFMVVISGYLSLSRKAGFRYPRWVPFIFVGSLLFSLVRGAIIQTAANIAMARWFRSRTGTIAFYAFTIGFLVLIITFSQTLLDNLEYVEKQLPFQQEWQQQAFRLGTISERLIGYQRVLLNPEAHTLFGHGLSSFTLETRNYEEGFSHDSLSQLLYRFGWVGVGVFISITAFTLWRIHSAVWRITDKAKKNFAAVLLSMVVLLLFSHIGGASYHVFPINLFMWLLFGMAWTLCKADLPSGPNLAAHPYASGPKVRQPHVEFHASRVSVGSPSRLRDA